MQTRSRSIGKPARALALLAVWVIGSASLTAQPVGPTFINGVDVSFLDHFERNGVRFKIDGQPEDGLEILKQNGVNTIRLRLWHTPPPGFAFNGLERTLEMARRVKEAGFALFLDFHYSDWWADPGKQYIPEAWEGLPFETLKDSLRDYTGFVIRSLSAQGTLPEVVQLGNEITSGMLWDFGRVGQPFDNPTQWRQLAELIQAADSGLVDGLGEDDLKPEVMIHIDRGGDVTGFRWFFDHLTSQGVDFDLIGVSYYSFWHGTMSRLQDVLQTAANRYGKDVVVAEVAYPWTLDWFDSTDNFVWHSGQLHPGYPASPEGQLNFLVDVKQLIRTTPSNHGRGLVYWEPTYVAAPWILGSPWENLTLFDNNYNALEALGAFRDNGSVSTEPVDVQGENGPLLTVYPNPFSTTTALRLNLSQPDMVDLHLYDLTGRLVTKLESGRLLAAGAHEISIDGTRVPAGVYLARLMLRSQATSRSILIHRFR